MTSSDRSNSLENIVIKPDLIHHSEYDIEVNDNCDDAIILAKDASKLVIAPTHVDNAIEFRKSKNTLLAIPIKDIGDIDIISNTQTRSGKDPDIKIIFNENQQDNKSISFKVKNNKYVDVIKQQINLLRDAEADPTIQKKIKSMLNPQLCSKCVKDNYVFQFRSVGNLCSNCFGEQYGKTLLQADKVEYYGGHKDQPLSGILGKNSQSGKMFLTENYVIFARDDKQISKRWEIFIPLSSVILNWDIEQQHRQKYAQWEATNYNNFGFGCGFIRESKKIYHLVVPYVDASGTPQEPEFSIQGIRKWASELYKMSIRAKVDFPEQQSTSVKRDSSNNR
jgi:hypothetical protein